MRFPKILAILSLALGLLAPAAASAQMSAMPQTLQDRLAEIGPRWGSDILGNVAITTELYTPLLRTAPHAGVDVSRDLSYGPDPRNKLDIFKPRKLHGGAPVVVFLHGGAYVRGDRSINGEIYGNVPLYFARNGMVGINATYRLAPAAKWPAAALDVKSLVEWVQKNIAQYGGDPSKIYLIGHSAGATHIANYLFNKDIRLEKPAIAGAVLMSGRYLFDPNPKDPNLANFQAYFGTDTARYSAMSPITHVKDAPAVPLYLVIAEYDNPDLDTQGALLLAEFCKRDRACPRFTRMERHNHLSMVYQFNTKDELMGREILDFMKRGK